jgi:hypothetical protein
MLHRAMKIARRLATWRPTVFALAAISAGASVALAKGDLVGLYPNGANHPSGTPFQSYYATKTDTWIIPYDTSTSPLYPIYLWAEQNKAIGGDDFERLATDPDKGGKITDDSVHEVFAVYSAMLADKFGHNTTTYPVRRSVGYGDFDVATTTPRVWHAWDVKSPRSPPVNASGTPRFVFQAESNAGSIVHELEGGAGTKILLDTSYLRSVDRITVLNLLTSTVRWQYRNKRRISYYRYTTTDDVHLEHIMEIQHDF